MGYNAKSCTIHQMKSNTPAKHVLSTILVVLAQCCATGISNVLNGRLHLTTLQGLSDGIIASWTNPVQGLKVPVYLLLPYNIVPFNSLQPIPTWQPLLPYSQEQSTSCCCDSVSVCPVAIHQAPWKADKWRV